MDRDAWNAIPFEDRVRHGWGFEVMFAAYLASLGKRARQSLIRPGELDPVSPIVDVGGERVQAPDLLVAEPDGSEWYAECKAKDEWTWHRKRSRWENSVNGSCWDAMLKIEAGLGLPCWVAFYNTNTEPGEKNAEATEPMPSGLWACRPVDLVGNVRRNSLAGQDKVYVPIFCCTQRATVAEFEAAVALVLPTPNPCFAATSATRS